MKITNVTFSTGVKHFEKDFVERHSLAPEYRNGIPMLFIGVYTSEDVKRINAHTGFKIVMLCGRDIARIGQITFDAVVSGKQMYPIIKSYLKQKEFPVIPMKWYSEFKPKALGDKIYWYNGSGTAENNEYYRADIVRKIKDYFGYDSVITGTRDKDIKYVIENYYKPSFVNLQLNPKAGFTTAMEMAHMGRLSVSNAGHGFCMPYETDADIIENIERIRDKGICSSDPFTWGIEQTDNWLHLDYWK